MSTQFNFTFDQGTTLNEMIGMEIAGQAWAQHLGDDVTINIHVGRSSDLPTGVIGGALPAMKSQETYYKVRNKLFKDRTTQYDNTAVDHLAHGTTQIVEFEWVKDSAVELSETIKKTRRISRMNLTNANAKALGIESNGASLDGYILMNSQAPWSFDFTGGPSATKLDYISTAMHEIGHVLGFVSGLDNPGSLRSVWQAFQENRLKDYENLLLGRANSSTPLDLFRFNKDRNGINPDFSYGQRGGSKIFSLDDGKTTIAAFATGDSQADGGDGYQASHWKNNDWYQNNTVMVPSLVRGRRQMIAWKDARAMDAIGWDVIWNDNANQAKDWAALRDIAKQSLASKLNKSVSWLNNNQTNAAGQLSQNRTGAITDMLESSVMYEWGVAGGHWWQKLKNLFQQRALYSTIDLGESPTPSEGAEIANTPTTPEITVQWSNAPTIGLGTSSESDNSATTVSTGIVQLMQMQADALDLNTPKSFSIDIDAGAKKPRPNQSTDWGIPGDGHWELDI